jgi:hypothetical protein
MWYRLAAGVPKLLSNPVIGGFWVGNRPVHYGEQFGVYELKNLLQTHSTNVNTQEKLNSFLSKPNRFEIIDGKKIYLRDLRGRNKSLIIPFDFYVDNLEIEKDKVFNVDELIKLLQTSNLNINTQEKLDSFLSNPDRFEIIDGKKIYIRSLRGGGKRLIIPFDFYVNNDKIEKDKTFDATQLKNLLQTFSLNVNTQEKLNSFLSNPDRFKTIDGNKIYLRSTKKDKKSLIIPFDFYVDNLEIEKDQVFSGGELRKLLNTKSPNINTQEKLDSFLSNPDRFEIIDGKKIYIRNTSRKSKSLIIPFDFYVNNDKIEKDKTFDVTQLKNLLQTDNLKINTQEKLDSFLSNPDRFGIIDGKKIYIRNTRSDKKSLIIPFDFYVNNDKIEKDKVFSINELKNLLQTNSTNINTQEKLNFFLNNAEFRIDENGINQYFPYKGSVREKYINKNLNITNEHNIKIISQKPISILNPGKSIKILKLDFAFVEDGNILLAIEVNGGQHYGFVSFGTKTTYEDWQAALKRDVEKINYCHNNNIPLLIFNHMLPDQYFRTTTYNLNKNPHMYDSYVPQSVIVNDEINDVADTSLEFIRRQIYSHLYPVFNGIISFDDDIPKKRYIKDTLILIAKLLGIYNGGIDKTDYIRSFDMNVDLTENYNICLDIYNNLYPDYPLDRDEKITYNDLSVKPKIKKPKEIEPDPLEI